MEASSYLTSLSKRLEGKVALITGGASGIGETSAKLFVQHGAKVVIADVQDDLGHSICKEIGSEDQLSFVHCDVTNENDIQQAVDTVVAKHGKLDIMFSNAGIGGSTDASITTVDHVDLERVFAVNVFGAFLCAKHAARVMIPSKNGSILFTSSAVSEVAGVVPHVYTSSKHAVVGLMKNLCVELGQHGIRVNCIAPHAINTPILRKGLGLPNEKVEQIISESANLKGVNLEVEDVAKAALFLVSDESKYVSGINFVLDGGYSTTNPAFVVAMMGAMS